MEGWKFGDRRLETGDERLEMDLEITRRVRLNGPKIKPEPNSILIGKPCRFEAGFNSLDLLVLLDQAKSTEELKEAFTFYGIGFSYGPYLRYFVKISYLLTRG